MQDLKVTVFSYVAYYFVNTSNAQKVLKIGVSVIDKDMNLEITNFEAYEYDSTGVQMIEIDWSGTKGIGKYKLRKDPRKDNWEAYSHFMDSNIDKSFLKELLNIFADSVVIKS